MVLLHQLLTFALENWTMYPLAAISERLLTQIVYLRGLNELII